MLNRTQRAAGVTVESWLRRSHILNFTNNSKPETERIKSRDIGAILVRCGQNICLAVCEALGFRTPSSKAVLSSIGIADLGAKGSNAVTISIQILHLRHCRHCDSNKEQWICPGNYIQVHELGKDGKVVMQKHYFLQIPGKIFNLFRTDLDSGDNGEPVWTIKHADLQQTMDKAWDLMEPDKDDILLNLEHLPMLSALSLPYKDQSGDDQLFFANPTVPVSLSNTATTKLPPPFKLIGESPIDCRLCGKVFLLRSMRNHVGRHIL